MTKHKMYSIVYQDRIHVHDWTDHRLVHEISVTARSCLIQSDLCFAFIVTNEEFMKYSLTEGTMVQQIHARFMHPIMSPNNEFIVSRRQKKGRYGLVMVSTHDLSLVYLCPIETSQRLYTISADSRTVYYGNPRENINTVDVNTLKTGVFLNGSSLTVDPITNSMAWRGKSRRTIICLNNVTVPTREDLSSLTFLVNGSLLVGLTNTDLITLNALTGLRTAIIRNVFRGYILGASPVSAEVIIESLDGTVIVNVLTGTVSQTLNNYVTVSTSGPYVGNLLM
jgi:hypothetical protein